MKKLLLFLLHTSVAIAQVQVGGSAIQIGGPSQSSVVYVNGNPITTPNFNGTSPLPDTNFIAATFKVTAPNVILEIPYGTNTTKGVVACDGTTTTCTNGVISSSGSGSGVQYPTYTYVMMGSSIQTRDDNHTSGQTITVTSGSCGSGSCNITNSGTNGLSVGDWVMVFGMTGFPQPTFGGVNALGTNLDTFKVTAATSTSFSFAYTGTATITGGSAYGYNYVTPYLTQTKPYFNGHGTVEAIDLSPSGGTYGLCTDMNTDYATTYHTIASSSTVFIVTDCHNDFAIGTSAATVESALQSLAVSIHADGAQLFVDTPSSDQFSCLNCSYQEALFANWLLQFKKAYNSPTGQYADGIIPMKSALNNALDANLFYDTIGHLNPGGYQRAADEYNNFMVTFGTAIDKDTPWAAWRESAVSGAMGLIIQPPVDSSNAFGVINAADNENVFYVDTSQGIVDGLRFYAYSANNDVIRGTSTSVSNVEVAKFNTPNLATGWPSSSNAVANIAFGPCQGNNYECGGIGFHYVGGNNTANYYYLYSNGVAGNNGSIGWDGTGAVYLPNQAPASGIANLQIGSGGNLTSGNPTANGTATLVAGTVTVSSTTSCAVGATCNYQLTNCGVGGTVGVLSVGTITAGTSFVINSSSATDTSQVCWRIN